MAQFLQTQLDFIFFFYGLAFVLLGGVCFAIRQLSDQKLLWTLLGAFGLSHGASEWLDLSALVLGDTPLFAVFRTGIMTLSFMLLLEFARRGAQSCGWAAPGAWIHAVLLAGVLAGGFAGGVAEANALARYSFGLTGALGSALVFASHSQNLEGADRRFSISASLALLCYGIAAGLIVPAAPIWPATVLNQEWFNTLTGVPIQLVRGLLACWIAFAIWGIWGQKIIQKVSAPHYTRNLRRLFAGTLTAIGAILLLGWLLTQYLGDIYERNIEAEAKSDIDLVVSYLSGTTAATAGIAGALAGAPAVRAYLSGENGASKDWVSQLLALNVAAARAVGGSILDTEGQVIAGVGHSHSIDVEEAVFLRQALEGETSHSFESAPPDEGISYYSVAPIYDENDATVRGAAIIERSLKDFSNDLRTFNRPIALVDPDGDVVLTNNPAWEMNAFWPAADTTSSQNQEPSILKEGLTGSAWVQVDGSRAYVQRSFINDGDWSVVMMTTAPGIFASRVLGIAMTLMATGMVLVYLAGRERHIFDSFQKDQRLELEELARDLRFKASTDPLTGLANRSKLNHQLDQEIARAARYGGPVAFIIYDVDHFKHINDNYGHTIGDKVLIELSSLASENIRKIDVLARWGGEEFAIIVPETPANRAAELAQSLRAAIEAHIFPEVGTITCSFGVAEYQPGDTAETLVERADKALYCAKVNGRNRVEMALTSDRGTSTIGRVA
jgi:diguanylate cyclase (GGDEF)-like protein